MKHALLAAIMIISAAQMAAGRPHGNGTASAAGVSKNDSAKDM